MAGESQELRFHPVGSRVALKAFEDIGRQRGVVLATYVSNNGSYVIELDAIYRDEEDDDGLREVPPDQLEDNA